jgi:hypothetical protein
VSLAQTIWRFNSRSYEDRTINLSAIAKAAKLRVATIWTYHHGKARWTADVWIKALLLLGAAEVIGDNIVIKIPEGLDLDKAIGNAYKNRRSHD